MVVRTLIPSHFKAPWGFAKKGAKGLRKIGPLHYESWKWPGQNREFPELTPKWQKNNRMELRRYTGVQPTGYDDPNTGKFVHLPEMIPELIVPDLTGFPLRPYVSYRTDIEIEKRIANTDKILAKNLKNPPIDKIWPPPPVDAKLLFDCFYADEIKKKYFETTTEKKKKSGFFASLIKKN